ncbi:MAG: hypothetical protein HIU83_14610, partial [Proteobacteria bacterium]|nr:hypothetical protein [Pseudomonadota bacterium]
MKRALICCTATVACLMSFVCSSGAAEPITTIREVRALFEDELFDMAYTVHTDKGRYAEALKVAEQAVKALPVDREWRRKAA